MKELEYGLVTLRFQNAVPVFLRGAEKSMSIYFGKEKPCRS